MYDLVNSFHVSEKKKQRIEHSENVRMKLLCTLRCLKMDRTWNNPVQHFNWWSGQTKKHALFKEFNVLTVHTATLYAI